MMKFDILGVGRMETSLMVVCCNVLLSVFILFGYYSAYFHLPFTLKKHGGYRELIVFVF